VTTPVITEKVIPPTPFPDLDVLNKLGDRTVPQLIW